MSGQGQNQNLVDINFNYDPEAIHGFLAQTETVHANTAYLQPYDTSPTGQGAIRQADHTCLTAYSAND